MGIIFPFFLVINMILLIPLFFWEKADPRGTLLWMAVMIFVPPVGFGLYVIIGPTYYFRFRGFKMKAELDELISSTHESNMAVIEKRVRKGVTDEEEARFIKTLGNAGAKSYSDNNDVKLYIDGQEKFRSLIQDIENAESSIHLEYYIVRNDRIGNKIMDAIEVKAAEGLKVRILFDAFGSGRDMGKRMRSLRKSGVNVTFFHKLSRLFLNPKKNNRNHRKIAIIDDKICYLGGFNIGDDYISSEDKGYWRDTSVRITGEAVNWVQLRFITDWRYAFGEDLLSSLSYSNEVSEAGNTGVQIISGGPDVLRENPIEMQYLMMFSAAKETLYLHTPFLAPTSGMIDGLRMAALSGVDVRLIIPDRANQPLVYWSNMHYASVLMKSNVKVYLYRNGFMHSKAIVADSKFCSVGSANLDERSMNLNFETNAMIYSEELGQTMTKEFLRDLERCEEFSEDNYKTMSLRSKFKVGLARLATSLL